jgi:hypothetical protein
MGEIYFAGRQLERVDGAPEEALAIFASRGRILDYGFTEEVYLMPLVKSHAVIANHTTIILE